MRTDASHERRGESQLLLDVFRAIEQRTTKDSANCCILILNFTGRIASLRREQGAHLERNLEPFQPGETERRMICASWLQARKRA